jgi:hypothetical protein
MTPFFINTVENQLTYKFPSSRTRSYILSLESFICSAIPGYWRTMRSTYSRKHPNPPPYIWRYSGQFWMRGSRSLSWCLCLSSAAGDATACGQLNQHQVGSLEGGNSRSQFNNSGSRHREPLCCIPGKSRIRKHRSSSARVLKGWPMRARSSDYCHPQRGLALGLVKLGS